MPTLYEILGCKPTDSSEDLRRAYRALLRKYHPDSAPNQTGPQNESDRPSETQDGATGSSRDAPPPSAPAASDEARASDRGTGAGRSATESQAWSKAGSTGDAGGDAAQLNAVREAWQVLGDPHKRRDYDRSLAQKAAGKVPSAGFRVAPPANSPQISTDEDDLIPVGSGPLIMTLVVAGALVVILTFTFVVSGLASAGLDRNQAPDDLTGQCLGGDTLERLVPCTGPHNARVVGDLAVDTECPATSTQRFIAGRSEAVCIEDPN